MKEKIIEIMREVADLYGMRLAEGIDDDTVLLDSGLDSLAYAVVVTRLEEDLGFDPFVIMDEPVYPRTLCEFVELYRRFSR